MIFEKEIVNKSRQEELDLSRGFAALLLVICHVGLYLGDSANKAMYTFADIIGSEPVAPVFMALMGASIVFSRHSDSKSMLFRGLKLFLSGYLLSAFRTLLARLIFGNIDEWTSVSAFFVVDIYQFSGLSFMLLALLKKCRMPSWTIFVLSIIMVLIGQIFIKNPPLIENKLLVYFVNLFIPINEWSCFPFLTWFFFPAFGLVFGELLCRCNQKKKLYGILLPISLVGIAYVYSQFYRYYPAYAENYYYGGNYYYMGIKNVLLTLTFITFSFSFWYFADSFIPKRFNRFLTFLGNYLTPFYIFSWIYISITMHFTAKFSITHGTMALIGEMIGVIILCYFSTLIFLKIKTGSRKTNN